MPVRNEENYIADTLRSLQAQTLEQFELLIFDNASSDATVSICRQFCESDSRIKLYESTCNIGQINNFNRCTKPAVADFVGICSGNDLLHPDYLKETFNAIIKDPALGLVYTRTATIDANDKIAERQHASETYFETHCDDPVRAGSSVISRFFHPASFFGLYRRSTLERLQPLRHIFGSDKIMVCEASLYANIACIPVALSSERKHDRQSSLVDIFSEDSTYGVSERSIFAKYESTAPMADMIWGFTDMFSRADILNKHKAALCEAAYSFLKDHYRDELQAEYARALDIFANNKSILLGSSEDRVLMLNRINFLQRVGRLQFVFPGDKELQSISHTISRLV
ncbi:MAG: glycosyltransferase family 2 protein [Pseudomonadota bacterium]